MCHPSSAPSFKHEAVRLVADNIQLAYPGEGSPHSLQAERLAKFTNEHFGHAQSPAAGRIHWCHILKQLHGRRSGTASAVSGTWPCTHHSLVPPAGTYDNAYDMFIHICSIYSQLKGDMGRPPQILCGH